MAEVELGDDAVGEQVGAVGGVGGEVGAVEAGRGGAPVRADAGRAPALPHAVRAAAALDCLNVALDHWLASDGELDLVTLLDEAFAALAPALPAVSSSGPPPPTSTAG